MDDILNANDSVIRELEDNRPRCGSFSKKIMYEDVEWIHLAPYSWVIVKMVK
jgi:hypothetical protein